MMVGIRVIQALLVGLVSLCEGTNRTGHTWIKMSFTPWNALLQADYPYSGLDHDKHLKDCNGQDLTPHVEVNRIFFNEMKNYVYTVLNDSSIIRNLNFGYKSRTSKKVCVGFEYADAILNSHGSAVLQPFVSVSSFDFAVGTTLYVKELDGFTLPFGSGTHNGCLLVDEGQPLNYQADFNALGSQDHFIFVYSKRIQDALAADIELVQPLNVLVNGELCGGIKSYPYTK